MPKKSSLVYTVKPRFNKVPTDKGNSFVISRFCSIHFKRPGWKISFVIPRISLNRGSTVGTILRSRRESTIFKGFCDLLEEIHHLTHTHDPLLTAMPTLHKAACFTTMTVSFFPELEQKQSLCTSVSNFGTSVSLPFSAKQREMIKFKENMNTRR